MRNLRCAVWLRVWMIKSGEGHCRQRYHRNRRLALAHPNDTRLSRHAGGLAIAGRSCAGLAGELRTLSVGRAGAN